MAMNKDGCPPYAPISLEDAVAFVRSKGMAVVPMGQSGAPEFPASPLADMPYSHQTLVTWACVLLFIFFVVNRIFAVLGELKSRMFASQ